MSSVKGLLTVNLHILKNLFSLCLCSLILRRKTSARPHFITVVQENANRKIAKVIQTIEVTEISGDAADILKVKNGSSSLLMHRLIIGSNGSPMAYTRLIGSGRTYKIQTEFERIR